MDSLVSSRVMDGVEYPYMDSVVGSGVMGGIGTGMVDSQLFKKDLSRVREVRVN